jgi:REP element-mobilizing transposase RayT
LGGWFEGACDAMHLELDALAIRPEYVRIGVIAQPDQKDDLIVSTLRETTARMIANNYPQMALDVDVPVFWTEDYLRINPADQPDQSKLNDFIHHLRR